MNFRLSVLLALWLSLISCDRKPTHTQGRIPHEAFVEQDTVIEQQLDLGLSKPLHVRYSFARLPHDTQYSYSIRVSDNQDTLYAFDGLYPWDPELGGAFRVDKDMLLLTESRRSRIKRRSGDILKGNSFDSFWDYYSQKDIPAVSFIYAFEASTPLLAYHPILKKLVPIYAP